MTVTEPHIFELVTSGNASVGAFRLTYRFGVTLVHGLPEGLPHTTV